MSEKILAIIPAYKEEERISSVVKQTIGQGIPVLVVDDCSPDQTARVAREAGAMVLSLPINLGYAGALQAGYHFAVKMDIDYVVQLDGDGQHDPAFCSVLLKPIIKGEADVVMGSRFLDPGSYRPTVFRRLGQRFFAQIASRFIGEEVTDPTTGFQALSREVAELYCTDVFPEDYPDADLRIILDRLGFRVLELPVRMYASEGESMHGGILKPIYYIYKMLLAMLVAPIKVLPKRRA